MGVIARMEAAWDGGGEGAVSTESLGAALGAGRGAARRQRCCPPLVQEGSRF